VADGHLVRCRDCTLLYQWPSPLGRSQSYYDRIYSRPERGAAPEAGRRGLFADFFRRTGPGAGRRLLDVGCGLGQFLVDARREGWRPTGVESSAAGLAYGRAQGLSMYPSTSVLEGGAFDVVTLWNVVEFFEDPVAVLLDVRRVLAPDGELFLRTPNALYHVSMCRVSRGVRWPPALAHAFDHAYFLNPLVWTPRSLRLLLERTGFRATIGNATLSPDDPYAAFSPSGRPIVRTAKAVVSMTAAAVSAVSGNRLLVSSSLEAWCAPVHLANMGGSTPPEPPGSETARPSRAAPRVTWTSF
jgi:2-polyprenyl-3-methyl-5-hydroxy-6-metoxy-1,4-benzoquinol methylase